MMPHDADEVTRLADAAQQQPTATNRMTAALLSHRPSDAQQQQQGQQERGMDDEEFCFFSTPAATDDAGHDDDEETPLFERYAAATRTANPPNRAAVRKRPRLSVDCAADATVHVDCFSPDVKLIDVRIEADRRVYTGSERELLSASRRPQASPLLSAPRCLPQPLPSAVHASLASSSVLRFPTALEELLLSHQVTGVRFILDRLVAGTGCLLADYMGLGKTLQCIATISVLLGTPALRSACLSHVDQWRASSHQGERAPKPLHDEKRGLDASVRPSAVPSIRNRPFRAVVLMPNGVLPNWEEEAMRFTATLLQRAAATVVGSAERPRDCHKGLRNKGTKGKTSGFVAIPSDCHRGAPASGGDCGTGCGSGGSSALRHPSGAGCVTFVPWDSASEGSANGDSLLQKTLPKSQAYLFTISSSSPSAGRRSATLEAFRALGGLLLTPYSQMHCPDVAACFEESGTIPKNFVDVIVLDEGHKIRNTDTMLSRRMEHIHTPLRVCATGYPLQNKLLDLHQLLHFVSSGSMSKSIPDADLITGRARGALGDAGFFKTHFADPLEQAILRDGDSQSVKQQLVRSVAWLQRRAALLYCLSAPLVLRRGLPFLTRLSGSHRDVYHVTLRPTKGQVLAYNALVESLPKLKATSLDMYVVGTELFGIALSKVRTSSEGLSSMSAVRRVMKSKPELFADPTVPPKMQFLLQAALVLKAAGKRLIAFSQFHSVLDEVVSTFSCHNAHPDTATTIRVGRCDGTMRVEDRVAVCRRFQCDVLAGDAVDVLVFSLRAGCEGLNLHGAAMVVSLDVSYNPATEHEAFARAFRLGQKHPVDVVVLTTEGSAEMRRFALQCSKVALSDNFIDGVGIADGNLRRGVPAEGPPKRKEGDESEVRGELEKHSAIAPLCEDACVETTSPAGADGVVESVLDHVVPMDSMLYDIIPRVKQLVGSVVHMMDASCAILQDDGDAARFWLHRDEEAGAPNGDDAILQDMACVAAQELRQEMACGIEVAVVAASLPRGADRCTQTSHSSTNRSQSAAGPFVGVDTTVAAESGLGAGSHLGIDADGATPGGSMLPQLQPATRLCSFNDAFGEDEFSFDFA